MGQIFSNNCTGYVHDIYEPTYISVKSKNSNNDELLKNSPFSRKPSFVRFIETTNKVLKICDMCTEGTLIKYNQCIECGYFHCGKHRYDYHKS